MSQQYRKLFGSKDSKRWIVMARNLRQLANQSVCSLSKIAIVTLCLVTTSLQAENDNQRFLQQASFGSNKAELTKINHLGKEGWFLEQLAKPTTLLSPQVEELITLEHAEPKKLTRAAPEYAFWKNAIKGDDQLRQRMAYSLSQILVISTESNPLRKRPLTVAYYQDLLIDGAFDNYFDLLHDISYAPAMASYLSFYGNKKADKKGRRSPDENYARELMQLFSIGVVELNLDGSKKLNHGQEVETYSNEDIKGLAKVFTGLSAQDTFRNKFPRAGRDINFQPLKMWAKHHSAQAKTFLGYTIPANTGGDKSISLALEHLSKHPNVAPFVSRLLIQRLVTSNPTPEYIKYVATAFNKGRYTLPSGKSIGDGRRGDLTATLGAILFAPEARSVAVSKRRDFGRIKEPILRITQWARAFEVGAIYPEFNPLFFVNAHEVTRLGQAPYRADSVFNFYRPNYVLAGSPAADAELVAPESLLLDAVATVGYRNAVYALASNEAPKARLRKRFSTAYAKDLQGLINAPNWVPDYSDLKPLAARPEKLVDKVNQRLGSNMTDADRRKLASIIGSQQADAEERIIMAIVFTMSHPSYLVQR